MKSTKSSLLILAFLTKSMTKSATGYSADEVLEVICSAEPNFGHCDLMTLELEMVTRSNATSMDQIGQKYLALFLQAKLVRAKRDLGSSHQGISDADFIEHLLQYFSINHVVIVGSNARGMG